ncbi:hypothetical protein D3C86_1726320 [compost metagenome]
MDGGLKPSDTFFAGHAELLLGRDTALGSSFYESQHSTRHWRHVTNPHRTAHAAELAGPASVVFQAFEVRQHIVPGPAAIAQRRPVVVVATVAARVHHAVDRAAPSECLASRRRDEPAIEFRIWLGHVAPVEALGTDHLGHSSWRADPKVIGAFPRLDQ